MYNVAVAFGLASLMICAGIALRAKVKSFQKMLIPVSVIAGMIGFILMNIFAKPLDAELHVSSKQFSDIVNLFFIFSFISIGLTDSGKKKDKQMRATAEKKKSRLNNSVFMGALGMGLIWCILYALTPVIGVGLTHITGKVFGMKSMYGIMIPFAFCQGPGQAATFGRIFEKQYGLADAEMVGMTYAAVGFLVAFIAGVPLARYGLKKNLSKTNTTINPSVERGYFTPEEQREPIGKSTTQSASIETLATHFAFMGISYLLALAIAALTKYIPVLGTAFSSMVFLWGMIAAYIVKAVMRLLKIDYLINNPLQGRITGWLSDYVVVCSFMAIELSVIGKWIVPILAVCLVCTVVTFFINLYFSLRLGSDHDFERLLGMYGTTTGTVPSGISLLRIVDPKLQTTTAAELGLMNIIMTFSTPAFMVITMAGAGVMKLPTASWILAGCSVVYAVLMKIFRVWKNKPTVSLRRGRLYEGDDDSAGADFLQGFLREEYVPSAGFQE